MALVKKIQMQVHLQKYLQKGRLEKWSQVAFLPSKWCINCISKQITNNKPKSSISKVDPATSWRKYRRLHGFGGSGWLTKVISDFSVRSQGTELEACNGQWVGFGFWTLLYPLENLGHRGIELNKVIVLWL